MLYRRLSRLYDTLRILIVLSFLCVLFTGSVVAQTVDNVPEELSAPNEIIVQFRPEYAPHVLEPRVTERSLLQQSFAGKVQLFLENMTLSLQDKLQPEENLQHITLAEIEAGVVEKTQMFDVAGESQENTYLLILDGTMPVADAQETFESLREVEYAQPNYLYEIQTQF